MGMQQMERKYRTWENGEKGSQRGQGRSSLTTKLLTDGKPPRPTAQA